MEITDTNIVEGYKQFISKKYVNEKMVKVDSSNVDRISIVYNEGNTDLCTLLVKFLNKDVIYLYIDVKVSDIEEFKKRESVGKALHELIYPYYNFAKLDIYDDTQENTGI